MCGQCCRGLCHFFDTKKNFIEENDQKELAPEEAGTDPTDKHLQSKGVQIQN